MFAIHTCVIKISLNYRFVIEGDDLFYVCINYEETKEDFPWEYQVAWIKKASLKRKFQTIKFLVPLVSFFFGKTAEISAVLVIKNNKYSW